MSSYSVVVSFISLLILIITLTLFYIFILNRSENKILIGTLFGYVVLAYLVKIIIVLYDYDQLKNLRSLTESQVLKYLPESIYVTAVFILGLCTPLILMQLISPKAKKHYIEPYSSSNLRILPALTFCFFAIIFKMFIHYKLLLGIPGVETSGPPVIGGLMTYFVRLSLFTLINILFYYSLKTYKPSYIFFSFLICMAFALIDLSIASKYSFVYQLYLLFILIFFNSDIPKRVSRALMVVLTVLSAIFIFIYKYINYYRFALLSGEIGWNAIYTALSNPKAVESSVWIEILNRIAGIENLIFALSYQTKLAPDIISLFNSSFASAFTEAVTGISGAINAVGATQIGVVALIAEGSLISVFGLSVMISVILMCFSFLIFKVLGNNLNLLASGIASIFCIYILFGSGNLIFYVKEIFVMLISVKMFLFFFLKNQK